MQVIGYLTADQTIASPMFVGANVSSPLIIPTTFLMAAKSEATGLRTFVLDGKRIIEFEDGAQQEMSKEGGNA